MQGSVETDSRGTILLATVERARLAGGDVQAALTALDEHEQPLRHVDRMNVRLRLWELTKDRTHLHEAHRLLCHLRDHAPGNCRETMENVPLHRAIVRAWDEHGAG